MKRCYALAAAMVVAASCSDGGGTGAVDPDAIPQAELAAVQGSLGRALATDTLYPTLAIVVFPFIDRATRFVNAPGDTTRLVGVELDIQVQDNEGTPINAQFTAVLGWRGYRPVTRTVDTVFFVLGAGRAPIDVALAESFSPDVAGSGTAIVVHEEPDSSITAWHTGTGSLVTTSSSYGSAQTQAGGGLTISLSRGTLAGHFAVTAADEVPGGATTIATQRDFSGGARGLKIALRGTFTLAPPARAASTP